MWRRAAVLRLGFDAPASQVCCRAPRCFGSLTSAVSQEAPARPTFPRGPAFPEDPTSKPGDSRRFDLGPYECHRVPDGSTPMRLDKWVRKNVCSNWDGAQKLISRKQVWLVPPDESSDQHRRLVMWLRFRPDCEGSSTVEPGHYVYFPRNMRPVPKRRDPTLADKVPPGFLLRHLLYKDTDFLAINKPIGWAVAPGTHVGEMHLQRFFPSLRFGLEEDPRLVHRLSTELGGVLLLARHRAAAAFAKDFIHQRAFWQRAFWGVVCGRTPQSGTISMPLANERNGDRMIAKPRREDDGGLPALTEYKTVRFSPLAGGISLLELNPYSGRHHQVRAHCAFGLRAPLVGDPLYYERSNKLNVETDYKVRYHSQDAKQERKQLLGPQPLLHLHSRQMWIKTFAGKDVLVTAPLPLHMVSSFNRLGWSEYLKQQDRTAAAQSTWRPEADPHVSAALAEAEAEAARLGLESGAGSDAEAGSGAEDEEDDAEEAVSRASSSRAARAASLRQEVLRVSSRATESGTSKAEASRGGRRSRRSTVAADDEDNEEDNVEEDEEEKDVRREEARGRRSSKLEERDEEEVRTTAQKLARGAADQNRMGQTQEEQGDEEDERRIGRGGRRSRRMRAAES